MPDLVKIRCPHCQASMKLKSRKPLGKKIACPKCSEPFVAKAVRTAATVKSGTKRPAAATVKAKPKKRKPAPVEDYDEFDEFSDALGGDAGYDDYGADDFDEFDEPPRKQSGARKAKKKKKKSGGGWVKWVLIGCGSAGGLAVLGVGIWLLVGLFGSKKLDLAWLPEDATKISVTRYADIAESELVKEALDDMDGVDDDISKMKEDWGLEPKDILSVTTARSKDESLTVVRTSIELDKDKILKHADGYEKTTYEGETIYRIGRNALYFPDEKTAISGPEESVKKAIDRGPKAEDREDLKFVDAGYDVVNVHLQDSSTVRGEILGISLDDIRGTTSGTSYSSSVKSFNATRYDSAEDAKEAMDKMEELRRKYKKEAEKAREEWEKKRKENSEKHEELVDYSHSGPTRSGDVIKWSSTTKPLKDKAKKMLGSSGALKIRALAMNPGQLFGISGFRSPFLRGRSPFRRRTSVSRRTRVAVYEVTIRSYNGDDDKAFAARTALKGTTHLDDNRTRISGNTITLYSDRGQHIDPLDVRRRLQKAGFQVDVPRLRRHE